MDAVHALVAPHLKVPVLKQGDLPRRALLEKFLEAPSVLFASQSFWEGVDVPGDALSMVIIDRLPFAPAQRAAAGRAHGRGASEAGGQPFDDYQVPQAALALRQGFGRLIRTAKDKGVVALGDVRVLREALRGALPGQPAPRAQGVALRRREGVVGGEVKKRPRVVDLEPLFRTSS